MALWTKNNLACGDLWLTLFIMKQHKKTFDVAGVLKMSELLFYNPLLTAEELKFEAAGIADFLDNVFRKSFGAKYETGVNKAKAIKDMVDILIVKNKTLADLAQVTDDNYNF